MWPLNPVTDAADAMPKSVSVWFFKIVLTKAGKNSSKTQQVQLRASFSAEFRDFFLSSKQAQAGLSSASAISNQSRREDAHCSLAQFSSNSKQK